MDVVGIRLTIHNDIQVDLTAVNILRDATFL